MKLVFDIESNGLLDTCNTIWCLVAQDVDTKETYSYSDYDDDLPSLQEGLQLLQDAEVLIGHNIIGYDIPAVKIITGLDLIDKKCFDTFIMSQTLRYKRSHLHGLAGWGKALGNSKLHYDDWTKYTKEMLTYCIQDVHLNTEVYLHLLKEFKSILKVNPLISKGLSVEHDIAKFNTIVREEGWNFNVKKAKENLKKLKNISDDIEKEIEPQLGTTVVFIDKEPKTPKFKKDGTYNAVTCRLLSDYFNQEVNPADTHLMPPGSSFQRSKVVQVKMGQIDYVKEWLKTQGWKPDDWTRKMVNNRWVNVSPKLTETSLVKLGPLGERIGMYYTLRNRISVLEGWLGNVNDKGRLCGNMWTIGTPSFRCRHEVIVNLPGVYSKWGRELRELFEADDGWKIVGADSSGNQLRGLCHYVNNPEFTKEVIYGDQHQRNADALGCSRSTAKTFLYAYLFGAGDAKLGETLTGKKDASRGKQSRADFASAIKGLQEIKDKIESEWRKRNSTQGIGWIHGLDGRPVFINSEHQCLNYLLQSAEGITCKAATSYQMQKIKEEGLRARPRIFYHDETAWTVHPDDADRVGEILKESFAEAPKWFGVECMDGGDYIVGTSYADVH
jgi:DNA polymerase-1